MSCNVFVSIPQNAQSNLMLMLPVDKDHQPCEQQTYVSILLLMKMDQLNQYLKPALFKFA